MTSKQRTQFNKMDFINIFCVTHSFILITISGVRSATVALNKSAEKAQLGNNSISLFCDYTLTSRDRFLTINLKRKRVGETDFSLIVSYYEDNLNASYYDNGSDQIERILLTNPTSANRRAILQFSSIQCTDEADYRCEVLYTVLGGKTKNIYSDIKLVLTAIPTFEHQSLIYTPSTNLAENQNVIFTCIGNVGREPQGNFSWYKYVGGQSSEMVITNGINPVSLTTVSGSCTYMRTEQLTMNLTREDNQMVIRCTIQQTTTGAGDLYIQTDRITVNYSPKINPILANPNLPTYSEGPVQLMLICKADSNPPSNYVWTRPDGTKQTGYQLRLRPLTTNHTGRYTCLAYAEWGGQNYTAKASVDIEVVQTTTPPPTTTIEPRTQDPWTSTYENSVAQQNDDIAKDCSSSALFKILFGVVVGVSVVLVAILSICLHMHRKMAAGLKQKLQTSNYLNQYDEHRRTLEGSHMYDFLERTL